MLNSINDRVVNWVTEYNPWTNMYGMARTIIALATASTLIFNDVEVFFRPTSDSNIYPNCGNSIVTIFCLVPNDYTYLNIIKWICVMILLLVASGWRPQITGLLHWWVSYSFHQSAVTIDGGENVAAVITLLLIPITLCDPRKNHWCRKIDLNANFINRRIISKISFILIRIQVAIIYFHSTVAKLSVPEWIDGTAVWYYMQSSMIGLNPRMMEIFDFILSSRLIVIPTWGTLVLQTVLVLALFAPKNYWSYILFFAVFMHEIFAVFLGLFSFSLIMLGSLFLFLRPAEKEFQFSKFHVLKYPIKRGDIKRLDHAC
ncbi:sporulation-delaying protein SdpB family protein [Bacillus xiapuensis]|uniref:sporulation-delaying protein SdpB family protein n=1 Tax=Bacillus xiapuensis TaxID=2014075 RepID=UPI000C24A43D|nr:sporulation-delaying protein SdpB family protein [Bacillus xiapuensis]